MKKLVPNYIALSDLIDLAVLIIWSAIRSALDDNSRY